MSIEVRLVETPPRSATLKTPTQWVLRRGSVEPTPPGPTSSRRHARTSCSETFGGEPVFIPARFATDQLRGGRDEKRTATGEETPEPTRPKSRDEPQSRRHDDG